MEWLDEILNYTERLQTEMHKFIEDVFTQDAVDSRIRKMKYENVVAVYFLWKIAEIEKKLELLREIINENTFDQISLEARFRDYNNETKTE